MRKLVCAMTLALCSVVTLSIARGATDEGTSEDTEAAARAELLLFQRLANDLALIEHRPNGINEHLVDATYSANTDLHEDHNLCRLVSSGNVAQEVIAHMDTLATLYPSVDNLDKKVVLDWFYSRRKLAISSLRQQGKIVDLTLSKIRTPIFAIDAQKIRDNIQLAIEKLEVVTP